MAVRELEKIPITPPFRGLNELTKSEVLSAEYAVAMNNMEVEGGVWRPRRGYSLYAANTYLNPLNPIIAIHEMSFLFRRDYFIVESNVGQARFYALCFRESSGEYPSYVPIDRSPWTPFTNHFTLIDDVQEVSFAETGGWLLIAYNNSVGTVTGPFAYARLLGVDSDVISGDVVSADATSIIVQPNSKADSWFSDQPHEVRITEGTGVGQYRTVSAWNTGVNQLSVDPNFTTIPDTTSDYQIQRLMFRTAGLVAPTVKISFGTAAAGGSLPVGTTYDYVYTYYDTNTGLESNRSPISGDKVSVGRIRVQWTIPNNYYNIDSKGDPSDPPINKVRIYRRNKSTGETDFQFVVELDLDAVGYSSTAGTYKDETITDELRGTSTAPTQHGVPPSTAYVVAHKGRVFYIPHNSRTIWFSETFDVPTGRSGGEYVGPLSFFTIPKGGIIKGGASFGEQLVIMQDDRVWRIDTSPLPDDPFTLEVPNAGGCSCSMSIRQSSEGGPGGRRLYYANSAGVWEYNGSVARNMTAHEIPITWEGILRTVLPDDVQVVLSMSSHRGCFDSINHRYIFVHSQDDVTAGRFMIVRGLRNEGWFSWSVNEASREIRACIEVHDQGGVERILLGFDNGRIGKMSRNDDEIFTDNGTAIAWSLKLPKLVAGSALRRSDIKDALAKFSAAVAQNVTVDVFLDQIVAATANGVCTIGGTNKPDAIIRVGGAANFVQLKISGTSAAAAFEFLGGTIFYAMGGQYR